ncbi:hypothetical protein BN1723_009766 [Verticillium longisporum]|uniref:Uncharacterized protein n=1 Tax=Verticillium longisporum TaxID=100787 RepID=A0A0G4M141_VERLO|nr:hypothetical protein BN1723_009766 [Verticillium longisporum]CRK27984.1 hypothetical protein BN1708_015046 [Verticillium longisporum]
MATSTTEPSAARSETLSAPKTLDPLSTKEIIYKKPIMIDDIVFTTTVDVMMKALQKRKAYSLRWQIFNDNIGEVLSFSTLTLRAISDNTTERTWSGETTFPDGPVRDGLKVFIEAMYIGAMEAIAKRLEK